MSDRIFTAEQIKVPAELPGLLKDLAKEAIRADPTGGKKGPDARRALALWAIQHLQLETASLGTSATPAN